jgi:hypothetical protein
VANQFHFNVSILRRSPRTAKRPQFGHSDTLGISSKADVSPEATNRRIEERPKQDGNLTYRWGLVHWLDPAIQWLLARLGGCMKRFFLPSPLSIEKQSCGLLGVVHVGR